MKRKINRKEYKHVVLNTRVFHKTYGERRRRKKKERREKETRGGKEKEEITDV